MSLVCWDEMLDLCTCIVDVCILVKFFILLSIAGKVIIQALHMLISILNESTLQLVKSLP